MLVENDKIDNFALEIDETKDKNNSCISNKKSKIIILIIIIIAIIIGIILIIVLTKKKDNKNKKDNDFYILEINDEIFKKIDGKSFKKNCTLPREDLRYIHVLHVDINNEKHEGEMICNKYIAETLIKIFKKLYEEKYPIEKMILIDEYEADDERAMEDNDSSCFNFRLIPYTTKISKHGLGLAVDINTLYNPYIKTVDNKTIIQPITGENYTDRNKSFIYKIEKDDICYKLFIENGFEWGGDWKDIKDYQHFEIPNDIINKLYPDNQ